MGIGISIKRNYAGVVQDLESPFELLAFSAFAPPEEDLPSPEHAGAFDTADSWHCEWCTFRNNRRDNRCGMSRGGLAQEAVKS